MLARPDLAELERLRAWVDDVQLSNLLGVPTYSHPGELKADVRVLLAEARKVETFRGVLLSNQDTLLHKVPRTEAVRQQLEINHAALEGEPGE